MQNRDCTHGYYVSYKRKCVYVFLSNNSKVHRRITNVLSRRTMQKASFRNTVGILDNYKLSIHARHCIGSKQIVTYYKLFDLKLRSI